AEHASVVNLLFVYDSFDGRIALVFGVVSWCRIGEIPFNPVSQERVVVEEDKGACDADGVSALVVHVFRSVQEVPERGPAELNGEVPIASLRENALPGLCSDLHDFLNVASTDDDPGFWRRSQEGVIDEVDVESGDAWAGSGQHQKDCQYSGSDESICF